MSRKLILESILYIYVELNFIFRAAKTLAKQEREGAKSQMLYNLEFITEMFIQLAHHSPFLTLQWCYILKLMNHSPKTLWYKILQPEQQHEAISGYF